MLFILRHIENFERNFLSSRCVFSPVVCLLSSHKLANIDCSRVWMSFFRPTNCCKFVVGSDWNHRTFRFFKIFEIWKIDVFFKKKQMKFSREKPSSFLKTLKVAKVPQNVTEIVTFLKTFKILFFFDELDRSFDKKILTSLEIAKGSKSALECVS